MLIMNEITKHANAVCFTIKKTHACVLIIRNIKLIFCGMNKIIKQVNACYLL